MNAELALKIGKISRISPREDIFFHLTGSQHKCEKNVAVWRTGKDEGLILYHFTPEIRAHSQQKAGKTANDVTDRVH